MHTGGLWSDSVWKLMQPPCCQPVFLHEWPAGWPHIFFSSHPVTSLSSFSSCSTSPRFSLSLHPWPPSTLIQLLISLPLSPYSPLPLGKGGKGFFFSSLQATSCSKTVLGLPRVTARLEVEIFTVQALMPRNLLRVGGREQTLACVS